MSYRPGRNWSGFESPQFGQLTKTVMPFMFCGGYGTADPPLASSLGVAPC
jgi:hypothetical protein